MGKQTALNIPEVLNRHPDPLSREAYEDLAKLYIDAQLADIVGADDIGPDDPLREEGCD